MVNVFPSNFSGKKSEKIVFNAFSKLKDSDLTIYYSRNYLYRNFHDTFSDGEIADFLIIHPKKGIIFLESKNGIISYNKNKGQWYQNEIALKKDPIKQAMEHKHKFLRKLRDETSIQINIPTIHAVLFPSTPKPEIIKKEFRFDIKPEMMLWREEFNNLDQSINKVFSLQKTKYFLSQNDLKKLHTLMMGRDFKNPLRAILKAKEEEQNITLSEQQESIMSSMFYPGNKKIAVRGLAGTGKTILLAKRAVDQINKGKKILILTKTKALNKFLQLLTNITDSKLEIHSVDYWVRNVCRKLEEDYVFAKDSKKVHTNFRKYFDNYVPNRCLDIFTKYPKEKYDLILVDESQDFHKNWYEALCFAKKDDGQVVFFYDPFQETFGESMIFDLEKAEDVMKYQLNINFRNTGEITNILQKLIKKFFPELNLNYSARPENIGLKPTLIEIKDWNDQITQICNIVEKLVDQDEVIPKNIGIIYDFSIKTPDPIQDHLNLTKQLRSKFYVIDAEQYSLPYIDKDKENYITKDSINRFKGLEKTVIILTNLKKINRKTVKNLYTGLSRARAHLIVISNKEVINELNDLIK
jgi:hypothetical protein